ncbi:hypothetical protein F4604DRAFT_1934355 [Suillus subluteus]|nr:hypothetical protein F4604DRAFT_1934355 [Suillus subluteus]
MSSPLSTNTDEATLHQLTRIQLQKVTKKHKVKANMKSELIIKEIFHILRPAYHDLAEDYQAGISTLEALQSQVATTKQHGSMIVEDVTGKMIRFIKNVFTLRENAIPDSPHGQAVGALQMDQETAKLAHPGRICIALQ